MKKQKKRPNLIKEKRIEQGLSQRELADAIRSTPISISRWEGGANPSLYFRDQLCKFFNMSRNELFPSPPPLHPFGEDEDADIAGSPAGVIQIVENFMQAHRQSGQAGREERQRIQDGKQTEQETDPDIQINRAMRALELEYRRRQLEREDEKAEIEHKAYLFERAVELAEKFIALAPDTDQTARTKLQYDLLSLLLQQEGHGESEDDIPTSLGKKRRGAKQ